MLSRFVAVTDRACFDFLSASSPHEEVDFWRPSGNRRFWALHGGELFLFKRHEPDEFIVGGGIFSHASNPPLSIAWEASGPKNGVATASEMRQPRSADAMPSAEALEWHHGTRFLA